MESGTHQDFRGNRVSLKLCKVEYCLYSDDTEYTCEETRLQRAFSGDGRNSELTQKRKEYQLGDSRRCGQGLMASFGLEEVGGKGKEQTDERVAHKTVVRLVVSGVPSARRVAVNASQ